MPPHGTSPFSIMHAGLLRPFRPPSLPSSFRIPDLLPHLSYGDYPTQSGHCLCGHYLTLTAEMKKAAKHRYVQGLGWEL